MSLVCRPVRKIKSSITTILFNKATRKQPKKGLTLTKRPRLSTDMSYRSARARARARHVTQRELDRARDVSNDVTIAGYNQLW